MSPISKSPTTDNQNVASRCILLRVLVLEQQALGHLATIVTHGTRDMPIWGYRYALDSNQAFYPKPSGGGLASIYDPEAVVRTRVLAVIDYLKRIQEK